VVKPRPNVYQVDYGDKIALISIAEYFQIRHDDQLINDLIVLLILLVGAVPVIADNAYLKILVDRFNCFDNFA